MGRRPPVHQQRSRRLWGEAVKTYTRRLYRCVACTMYMTFYLCPLILMHDIVCVLCGYLGPTPESLKGTRTRSSSRMLHWCVCIYVHIGPIVNIVFVCVCPCTVGSLSGRSSGRGSSASSSRASSRRPSLSHLSDIEPSPPTSLRGSRTASNKNKRCGQYKGFCSLIHAL